MTTPKTDITPAINLLHQELTQILAGEKNQLAILVDPQPDINGMTVEWKDDHYPSDFYLSRKIPAIYQAIIEQNPYGQLGQTIKVYDESQEIRHSKTCKIEKIEVKRLLDLKEKDAIAQGLNFINSIDKKPPHKVIGQFYYNYQIQKYQEVNLLKGLHSLLIEKFTSKIFFKNHYALIFTFKPI